MRKLTELDSEEQASKLSYWLTTQGIESQFTETIVWIMDEDALPKAKKLLASETNTSLWQGVMPPSKPTNPNTKKEPQRHRHVDVRTEVWRDNQQPNLTLAIIFVCTIIFLGIESKFLLPWVYAFQLDLGLAFSGQLWRFVTPIFLHFGWLHIIFNMLWTYQLGGQIESVYSPKKLALLMIGIGICSNMGQALMSGPLFGGMSGVIYGLLGYSWGMTKWHPENNIYLDSSTMGFMMIWLVLCMSGIFGPVANTAHVMGLVAGVAWAKLEAIKATQRR